VAELGPDQHLELDPLPGQRLAYLAHAVGEVGHVGHEVAADVRRRDDRRRALETREAGDVDALLHVGRPVVHAGQEVEVDLGSPGGRAAPREGSRPECRQCVGVHRCTPSFRSLSAIRFGDSAANRVKSS
jgi:hypothetical protein